MKSETMKEWQEVWKQRFQDGEIIHLEPGGKTHYGMRFADESLHVGRTEWIQPLIDISKKSEKNPLFLIYDETKDLEKPEIEDLNEINEEEDDGML